MALAGVRLVESSGRVPTVRREMRSYLPIYG